MASTLIHNVRIFSGEEIISQDGYVLLEKGLIKAVSSSTPQELPKADVTIDGKGYTILPGLIDAHVHCHKGISELQQSLRFGVTTVLDMFSLSEHVQQVKKECAERLDAADMKSSCYAATVEGGWPAPVIRSTVPDKAFVSSGSWTVAVLH